MRLVHLRENSFGGGVTRIEDRVCLRLLIRRQLSGPEQQMNELSGPETPPWCRPIIGGCAWALNAYKLAAASPIKRVFRFVLVMSDLLCLHQRVTGAGR
jgi:hypothetical protein